MEKQITIDKIERAIPVAVEATKEQEKLARQAKQILGYSGLLSNISGGRLQAILENLEIEILDPKSVFDYQSQFGSCVLSEMVTYLRLHTEDEEEEYDDEEEDEEPKKYKSSKRTFRVPGSSWVRSRIVDYVKAIPEFVINKAIQIKKALPQVEIFVEELQTDPDPFLVVTFETDSYKEEYYVEVWEEPKFEGRFVSVNSKKEAK